MIYLMRHGLDDEDYIGGWSDVSLTKKGREQVKEKLPLLRGLNIKNIISSDIKRAKETAKIISDELDLPITYSDKLRELDKGLLTGMLKEEALAKYPQYMEKMTIDKRYPEGECLLDLYNRVKLLLDDLMKLDDVLLVTHRGVINMIYFLLEHKPLDMNKKQFKVTHASIHYLDTKEKTIRRIDKMSNIEAKIVLTGGPCAGKTTALSRIEEYFTDLGYKVLIVGESATELIKGGARPFGQNALDLPFFQDAILTYQLNKEDTYEYLASGYDEDSKCIIIYDRGAMDNSAYVEAEVFDTILAKKGLSRLSLMDRYDMVIHLVTAADGAEDFYTLENNATRTETKDEAIELDHKTMRAWCGHNNLKIIGNETSFEEKLNKVIDNIHNLLGHPISIKKQKKYLIDETSISEEIIKNSVCINISQIYLGSDDYEKRLRKRTFNGEETYYLTIQKQDKKGTSKVLIDKKISRKEYDKILSEYQDYRVVNKKRYSFIEDKTCYRLDIFDDSVILLEVDGDTSKLPKGVKVTNDVTNSEEFYNTNLALENETKKTKKYS